jgi:hypothetical protein
MMLHSNKLSDTLLVATVLLFNKIVDRFFIQSPEISATYRKWTTQLNSYSFGQIGSAEYNYSIHYLGVGPGSGPPASLEGTA